MQEIKLPDVVVLHIPATMIAEKMIQLRYRGGQVLIPYPVDQIEMLTRYVNDIDAAGMALSLQACSHQRLVLQERPTAPRKQSGPAIDKPLNRMYFHQSIPNVPLNYMRNVEMSPESARFQVIRIDHP